MTTYGDWERHLYRAITGNRLSDRTYTLGNALKELGARGGKQPWKAVGASRETWRRWHLPADAKLHQQPTKHAPALLAYLRRSRLSAAREAKIRANSGCHFVLTSNYEDGDQRDVGAQTLSWASNANDQIMDAYLQHGIGQAVQLAIASVGSAHFASWMDDAADGSSQSYTVDSIDLTRDHNGRTRPARRRRR